MTCHARIINTNCIYSDNTATDAEGYVNTMFVVTNDPFYSHGLTLI